MPIPTQNEIEQRAYRLWQQNDCPEGRDTEIWLEAERLLMAGTAEAQASDDAGEAPLTAGETRAFAKYTESLTGEPAPAEAVTHHLSSPRPEPEGVQLAFQAKSAREPQVPHKTAPRSVPAATGKPLWSKPHSALYLER